MTVLPRISVIIPCYRAEKTLRGCVASVLQGAPAALEVLLVEDGSPDGTGALCDELAATDARDIAAGARADDEDLGLELLHGSQFIQRVAGCSSRPLIRCTKTAAS